MSNCQSYNALSKIILIKLTTPKSPIRKKGKKIRKGQNSLRQSRRSNAATKQFV